MEGAATELEQRGVLRLLGDLAADTAWFERQVDAVRGAIDTELKRHPERSGVTVAGLRAQRRTALTGSGSAPAAVALPAVIDAVLTELARHGYRREGSLVRPPGHAATLPPGLEQAVAAALAALAANPLAPPGRAQLADRAGGATVVAYLIASDELVVLAGDVVMATAAYRQARTGVIDYLRRHQRAAHRARHQPPPDRAAARTAGPRRRHPAHRQRARPGSAATATGVSRHPRILSRPGSAVTIAPASSSAP